MKNTNAHMCLTWLPSHACSCATKCGDFDLIHTPY